MKKYFFVRKNIFSRKIPKNIFKKNESIEKIFFGRVEIFFEHQGIRKILLRIECAHSQRSKITLKHTFKESRKKVFFLSLGTDIDPNPCMNFLRLLLSAQMIVCIKDCFEYYQKYKLLHFQPSE